MRRRPLIAGAAIGWVVALAVGLPATAADPVRDAQWHLGFLDVSGAHKINKGRDVVVAVIDTGVDAAHPDLANSVLVGTDLTADGGNRDGTTDTDGHGTGMAGLISGHGRVLGLAPDSRILPVRDTTTSFGFDSRTAGGVEWAIDHGARIICVASVGDDESALRAAVQRAIAADIVVVAGAGNYPGSTTVRYPAAYPGVIAAVGVDKNGQHAEVSVTGPQAVLAAPAVDIVSTGLRPPLGNGYRKGTGTSDATAIIAGVAALVRSKFPDLSAAEVVHRLTATADDKGPPGRDDQYGFGIVNPVRALTATVPTLTPTATGTASGPPADDDNAPTALVLLAVLIAAAGAATTVVIMLVRRRSG